MIRTLRPSVLSLFLMLTVSLTSSAGVYQCKKGDVSAPCKFNAWGIGGDALYFSAGAPQMIADNANQSYNYAPSWGFRLSSSKYFDVGTDFTVNWIYLTVKQDFIENEGGNLTANGIDPNAQPFTQSSKLSWLMIELGQLLSVGERWNVRMHGGFQYISLQDKLNLTVGGFLFKNSQFESLVGGRIGTNITYHLISDVSFYTDGAFGVLYGSGRQISPPGGLFDSSASGFEPVNRVFNTTGLSVDYDMGLRFNYASTYGDMDCRIGWAAYAIIGGATSATWQGLIFGMKTVV